MTVSFKAFPVKGKAPLDVDITNVHYDKQVDNTVFSQIVNASSFKPIGIVASAGYFGKALNTTLRWEFGDGTGSTSETPPPHRYNTPGLYKLTAISNSTNGVEERASKLIKVLDETLNNLGIGMSTFRENVNYGQDDEQGFGWSTDGGDGNTWVDTKASIVQLFDDNEDSQVVVYDSLTGLPYTINPRKSYDSSNIVDAWNDKIDELINDIGVPIPTIVKLQEIIGSHESFEQQMSDISLFFSPIYKENQGLTGYNEDGLRDSTVINLHLFKNDLLVEQAETRNIPMRQELFFDKAITGGVLQLSFDTNNSEYRFPRAECIIENYDKAKFPFKQLMSEGNSQNVLSNVVNLWITRNAVLKNMVTGTVITTPHTFITGVDNVNNSAVLFNLNYVTAITGTIMVVSDSVTPFIGSGTLQVYHTQNIAGRDWNFILITSGNYTAINNNVAIYDLRCLSVTPSSEDLLYYRRDVIENSANNVCDRF
jgi:hypothetical protein